METMLRTFGLAVVSKGKDPVCAFLRQFHEQVMKGKVREAKGTKDTDSKDVQQETLRTRLAVRRLRRWSLNLLCVRW